MAVEAGRPQAVCLPPTPPPPQAVKINCQSCSQLIRIHRTYSPVQCDEKYSPRLVRAEAPARGAAAVAASAAA